MIDPNSNGDISITIRAGKLVGFHSDTGIQLLSFQKKAGEIREHALASIAAIGRFKDGEKVPLEGTLQLPPSQGVVELTAARRQEIKQWLLAAAIRDSFEEIWFFSEKMYLTNLVIEAIGQATIAERLRQANLVDATGGDELLQQIFSKEWKKFEGGGILERLDFLQKLSRCSVDLIDEIKSINQLRACLTHRNGIVGKKDAGDGREMILKFRRATLEVTEADGGTEWRPVETGVRYPREMLLRVNFSHSVQSAFPLGSAVSLASADLENVLWTLYLAGLELLSTIERGRTQPMS